MANNVNNRRQRNHLYKKTFEKWSVPNRLAELLRANTEVSLSIQKFGNSKKPMEGDFTLMCEKLSDFETLLEVTENTFPALRSEIDRIKREKLSRLNVETKAKEKEQRKKAKQKAKAKTGEQKEPVTDTSTQNDAKAVTEAKTDKRFKPNIVFDKSK